MKTKHKLWRLSMNRNFKSEFNKIGQDLTKDTYIHSMICGNRDQFSDIKTSDRNMIPLTTGYLNGSYIIGKKYIATQYPLKHTIDHFWTMVNETNSKIIINLTGNNHYLKFKTKFNIHIKKYYEDDVLEVNKLTFNKNEVYHISFKKWIDHSVPLIEDFEKLMLILSIYENSYSNSPIVVHCRAGVGRTGTLILAHYILEQNKNNILLNPIDVVKEMRSCRAGMIQGFSQFSFAIDYINIKINHKKHNTRKKLNISSDCGLEYCGRLSSSSLSHSSDSIHT